MLQQGSAFNGFSIEASDGQLGTVSDFLFDEATWKLRWLVVETGSWLTGRKILLHPTAVERVDLPGRAVLVKLTRKQVEDSPSIATDEPVSTQMEYKLYGYYGVEPLWAGGYYGGNAVVGAPVPAEQAGTHGKGDPHLRSVAEVTGYNIRATDGHIGHLENFLFEDASWDIKYLVIDTKNWWFGKHVLLATSVVREIDWQARDVCLDLTCYKIKGSPPWDAAGLLDRAYEQALQAYYEWPAEILPAKHSVAPKVEKVDS